MEQETKHKLQIYVVCLASYNNGILHGYWIEANRSADEIMDDIQTMLEASPIEAAEEWAIHDYELGGVDISEYESTAHVAAIAAFIAEHGDLGTTVLAHFCGDLTEAVSALTERYHGEYPSVADYAEEMMSDCGSIPEQLRFYIDFEAMARDWELSGDIFTLPSVGNFYIFAGC